MRWPMKPLGEVTQQAFLGVVLSRQRPPTQDTSQVPIVTLQDLEDDPMAGQRQTVQLGPRSSYARYEVKEGDVLLAARGATLRVALAPDLHGALATSSLIVLRPAPALRGAVLAAYLRGPRGQAELQRRLRVSTTTQSLNVKDVVAMPVPVPALAAQREIGEWFESTEAAYRAGLAEARCRRAIGSAMTELLLFPERHGGASDPA